MSTVADLKRGYRLTESRPWRGKIKSAIVRVDGRPQEVTYQVRVRVSSAGRPYRQIWGRVGNHTWHRVK